MKIADLFFSGRLDDGPLQVDVKKSGDKAGKTLGSSMAASLKKSFSGGELGKGLVQGLGIAGALGGAQLLTTGLGALTSVIGDSIDAASNLNETVSKGKVIFGENADAVENWADTASTSFGQSKRAALDVASTFAGLFSTVGLTLDDATDKAKALTELGSDLASFFNTDVATATQALRSGLSGESEPLRQFNVFLSDAAVQAKAAQLGMKKLNGALTEGQKVTARYAIILDQTTAAQGDFARTSDGLANSTRTMEAAWEDASAKLGQALLPVMTAVVQFIATDAIPAFLSIIESIGAVVESIGPFVDAVMEAQKSLEGIGDTVPFVAGTFDLLGKAVTLPIQPLFFLKDRLDDLGKTSKYVSSQMVDDAVKLGVEYAKTADGMAEDARESAKVIGASASQLGPAISDGLERAADSIDGQPLGAAIAATVKTAFAALPGLGKAEGNRLGAGIAQGIREKRDAVDQSWQDLLDAIHNGMKPAAERAKLVGQLVSTELIWGLKSEDPRVRAQAQATKQTILDRLAELGGAAAGIGKSGMAELAKALKSKDPDIRKAAWKIYKAARDPIVPIITNATTWGENAGENFADGLRSRVDLVASAAGAISKALSNNLRVSSPAKEGPLSTYGGPEGWGARIATYFAKGLRDNLPDVASALGGSLRMPSMSLGSAVPSMAMAGYGGASVSTSHVGGVTNNYYNTANVTGLVKATDPLSIARQLGRSARSGEFRPVVKA